jgi:hypothetical protein
MSSTARYTATNTWSDVASWNPAQAAGEPAGPVYNYLSVWILLVPLLFIAANGMLSLLNLGANSGDMTQNGSLLKTAQAVRPQVVFYYHTMAS